MMADAIAKGLKESGCRVTEFNTNDARFDITDFPGFDCVAFGSPDYFSCITGGLKTFMDDHYIQSVTKKKEGYTSKQYVLFCTHGGGGKVKSVMKELFKRVGTQVGETLGTEERDIIRPAVEAARAEGINALGPFPADTFFMTVNKPIYDVYVGMYHDQGRIAMKLLDFGHAVTLAEGLPILFSTVGHGTAYDIVGKGIARHENMKEAILLAARRAMARRKERV